MTETPNRLCLQCSKPFNGRSDKKFCCHYCRTDYNNIIQKNKYASCIKNINEILLHNREILMEHLQRKTGKTTEEKLVAMGFHFHFHTHSVNKQGVFKTYCYDIGYTNEKGVITIFGTD